MLPLSPSALKIYHEPRNDHRGDNRVANATPILYNHCVIVRRWLGDPDFIPIDGAGHLPQVEQPGAFVKALKRIALSHETA